MNSKKFEKLILKYVDKYHLFDYRDYLFHWRLNTYYFNKLNIGLLKSLIDNPKNKKLYIRFPNHADGFSEFYSHIFIWPEDQNTFDYLLTKYKNSTRLVKDEYIITILMDIITHNKNYIGFKYNLK